MIDADFRREFVSYLESHPSLHAVTYWVAATIAGFTAVLYTGAFHWLSETVMALLVTTPVVMFCLGPVMFVLSRWLVIRFAPGAGGSGVPQVMAAIEMDQEQGSEKISELLGPKVIVIKILSSFSALLGGAALGPEGPTIQISASIFQWIGSRFRVFWPQIGHQSLIIAGGAAGIAAAFNTPLGGIVFAIEELSQQYFNRFKTVLISAVIISGMVAQWFLGPYLYFGYPALGPVSTRFLPWAILVGLVCGIGGAGLGKLLLLGHGRVSRLSSRLRYVFAAFAGLFAVTSAYLVSPQLMGGGVEVIGHLLFSEEASASWGLVLGRIFAPMLAFLSGCAGGLLAPSLAAGAVIGSKMHELLGVGSHNLLVLLGMAGFLSGITRAPFTAFVLVLEMTDRHSIIFPMMVTSISAYAVAHLIDARSFYDYRREYYGNEFGAAKTPTPPS